MGIALAAACAGSVAAALASPQPAAAAAPMGFAERLLIAHNLERDRQNVPRLKWSARLAGEAQAWAATLARSNRFEHSNDRSGAGENLWMGSAGRYSAEAMIDEFVAEGRMFRAGQFPNVSKTGSWHDVGHYTQLIWPATEEVGCAVARGTNNDILVCRYYPAGNVMGERIG
jgi:uncharacterized protein YkwD